MALEGINSIPVDGWHGYDTTAADGGRVNPIPLGATKVDYSSGTAKRYIWLQIATSLINSAFAANEVANLQSATSLVATNDVSTSLAGGSRPVGACRANSAVPTSTATVTYYAWFQIGGIANVKTNGDNNGVVGDAIIPATGTDGAADMAAIAATSSDGTIGMEFGICLASESASLVSALLRCLDFAGF